MCSCGFLTKKTKGCCVRPICICVFFPYHMFLISAYVSSFFIMCFCYSNLCLLPFYLRLRFHSDVPRLSVYSRKPGDEAQVSIATSPGILHKENTPGDETQVSIHPKLSPNGSTVMLNNSIVLLFTQPQSNEDQHTHKPDQDPDNYVICA